MSATQAQIAFAAEFVLFLAALAGSAVVVLRQSLLVRGRSARTAMVGGFVLLAAAALVHGSLLEPDAGALTVVAPRVLGLVLLVVATVGAGTTERAARWSLRGAAAVLGGAEALVIAGVDGTVVDLVRVLGAAVLVATMLFVARRSIPARVAAGAAGTVLLVVLAVSVTLSTVVVANVEDELLGRTGNRAAAEVADASQAPDAVRVRATGVAELLVERAAGDARAARLLVALAEQPRSPEGLEAGRQLAASLAQLGDRPDLFPVEGMLAFVTPGGEVVPGPGVPASGSTRAQLGFLDVVQDAITARGAQSAPDILGGSLLAVAAAPVTYASPEGPRFIGVVVTTDAFDDAYLLGALSGDDQLSLAVVGRDGVLARAGEQPGSDALRAIARRALRTQEPVSSKVEGRFLSARALSRGGQPLVAIVASAPSRLADDTRQSLFRTLFVVALLATLAAIVLAALIGNRIGRGLRRLTATAAEIEAGNLDVRAGLDQPDELGVLGTAFDRMAGSLRTMTDELREAAIDEARLRGRLEAVVGGMGEALVAVDADGRITEFNDAAQHLFGVRATTVQGQPASRLTITSGSGEDLTARLSSDRTATWSAEGTVRRRNGEEVPVALSGAPLRGPTGASVGAVAVVRDLRGEREVDRMKTEFLSNISHEMKTPLTPIKGYAQMLASRDVSPERTKAFAREIASGARQLERVITQLVNFATMAAGRLEPRPEPLRARALLDDAVARWGSDGHRVERRVARGTPDLLVDRRLLDMSLDELLDNALKYSPDGGRIVVAAAPDGEGSVLVSVSDRGVGVPAEQLEAIFADFAQGDGSSTREFGGLGLGLPLVRHVAEAHGGELTGVSSEKGSTFTLRLPAVVRPRRVGGGGAA